MARLEEFWPGGPSERSMESSSSSSASKQALSLEDMQVKGVCMVKVICMMVRVAEREKDGVGFWGFGWRR